MNTTGNLRWYQGVSRYQWLVLVIASLGWVFDAFEGQLFNVTRNQMLAEILGQPAGSPDIRYWGDVLLAVFLLGGTIGGIFFAWLGDRIGRKPVLALTILFYSIFSGLTYFATELWHVATLRFLVAMGVGGEWAVAAALVAEVMPKHARAHMSGIFHSTSILGATLAAWVGIWVGTDWRLAFLIGVLPALLVLWVRMRLKEPESWEAARNAAAEDAEVQLGSFRELLTDRRWRVRAWGGMFLAAVGLATFWGVAVAGQDIAREFLLRDGVDPLEAAERAKFAFGNIEALGAGIGMFAFGAFAVRLGRKGTFALYHIGALFIVAAICYLPTSYTMLLIMLPVFGFFTWGLHAGYAIYFPELFPDHLRATGTGFCFNGGRLLASSMLVFSGWLKGLEGMNLENAIVIMSSIFALGLVVLWFMPETKGKNLPGVRDEV